MLNNNTSALGLIFPNTFDAIVPELTNVRLMASIPFASRYRLIDFVLSSMSNCGIDNITVVPNRNYMSLMDHIGTGREWDLTRKNGGVRLFPPFAENGNKLSNGRIGALANIMRYLKEQKEKMLMLRKLVKSST